MEAAAAKATTSHLHPSINSRREAPITIKRSNLAGDNPRLSYLPSPRSASLIDALHDSLLAFHLALRYPFATLAFDQHPILFKSLSPSVPFHSDTFLLFFML